MKPLIKPLILLAGLFAALPASSGIGYEMRGDRFYLYLTPSGGGTVRTVQVPYPSYSYRVTLSTVSNQGQLPPRSPSVCSGSGGGGLGGAWCVSTADVRPPGTIGANTSLSWGAFVAYANDPGWHIPVDILINVIKAEPWICLYAVRNMLGPGAQYESLNDCIPTGGIQTPTQCVLTVPPVIDFGTLTPGVTVTETIVGSVTCDSPSSVFIRVTDMSGTNQVPLSGPSPLTTAVSVNGVRGDAGVTLNLPTGGSSPFIVGATMTLPTNTTAGVYSGNAVVRVDWP
jgi:hypothetical protein